MQGCLRRNLWTADWPREEPWRFRRGNTVLDTVAERHTFQTPLGPFEAHLYADEERGGTVWLTFRGGRWKEWWTDDIRLVLAFLPDTLVGAVVLNELDGELHLRYVPAPSNAEREQFVADTVRMWERGERIPKNYSRAFALCPHCPVKARCDALDIEEGKYDDWPPVYRPGPAD